MKNYLIQEYILERNIKKLKKINKCTKIHYIKYFFEHMYISDTAQRVVHYIYVQLYLLLKLHYETI